MSDAIDPLRLHCPGCEEAVDIPPESAGQLVRCPYCSTDFFASAEESHLPVVDDTSPEIAEQDRANAFDKLRIRNYTALRMGAIRARSWWLVGFWLASLLILDMLGRVFLYVWYRHYWGWPPTINVLIAAAEFLFARYARHRSAEFKREIDHSAIAEPTTPPDFSTLNDGNDRWKDLENVR